MGQSSLGDRMKGYESSWESSLTNRLPIIARLDGRHFHSFTQSQDIEEPFSLRMSQAMVQSAYDVLEEVSGAQLAYIESDEISVLITPYTSLEFEPFLGNRVQKLCSILSSIVTQAFNFYWHKSFNEFGSNPAMFDCRVFTVPKDEVCNYFIWRQKDWERNSVHMLGRDYFSHNEMHGWSNADVKNKLWDEHKVSWEDLESWKKNGVVIRKETIEEVVDHPKAPDELVERNRFVTYRDDVPRFAKSRSFINDKVYHTKE